MTALVTMVIRMWAFDAVG